MTFGGATPDLYPTDVYTLEYDGFADFPQYPIDPFSDTQRPVGGFFDQHLTYMDLTSEQIPNAIPLETAGDALTDYYMIPVENLPLLDPLRWIPFVEPAGRPDATRHDSAGEPGLWQHHRRVEAAEGTLLNVLNLIP